MKVVKIGQVTGKCQDGHTAFDNYLVAPLQWLTVEEEEAVAAFSDPSREFPAGCLPRCIIQSFLRVLPYVKMVWLSCTGEDFNFDDHKPCSVAVWDLARRMLNSAGKLCLRIPVVCLGKVIQVSHLVKKTTEFPMYTQHSFRYLSFERV